MKNSLWSGSVMSLVTVGMLVSGCFQSSGTITSSDVVGVGATSASTTPGVANQDTGHGGGTQAVTSASGEVALGGSQAAGGDGMFSSVPAIGGTEATAAIASGGSSTPVGTTPDVGGMQATTSHQGGTPTSSDKLIASGGSAPTNTAPGSGGSAQSGGTASVSGGTASMSTTVATGGALLTGGSALGTGGAASSSRSMATGGAVPTGGTTARTTTGWTRGRGGSTASAPQACSRVSGTVAKDLVDQGALLLDVREPSEFAAGSLPGAINIPLGSIESRISELDVNRPIVVYCASGTRAGQAMTRLCSHGYTVYDLGAMSNWPS